MIRNLGSALGALLLISSLTTSNALFIEKRALTVPATLPGQWTSKGCYVDIGRTLSSGGYTDNLAMTDESCISYCSTHGFIYAGTEYGQECYCGMSIAATAGTAPDSDCNSPCTGNATEPCGGSNRLNVFWSGTTGPQTNPGPGLWSFAGCYTEGTTGRSLTNGVGTTGGSAAMTVALCTSACQAAGYNLAGAEYSGECYCGNSIANDGALASDGLSGCNMLCNGNFSEYCGGGGHLDVYNYNNAVVLPPWTTTTVASTSSTSTSSTSSKVSTTSSSSSSSTSKPVSSTSSKPTTSSSSSSSKTSTSTSSKPTSTSSKLSTSSSSKSSSSTSKSSTSSSKISTSSSTSKSSTSSSKYSTSTSSSKSSTSSTSTKPSSSSTSSSTSKSSISSTSTKPSSSSTSSSTSKSSISSTSTKPTSSSTSSSTSKSSSSSSSTKSSTTSSPTSSSTTSSATAAPTLGIKPTIGAYSFQGCYTEGTGVRALAGAAFYDYVGMTLEQCATNCATFTYFGIEYGGECYCGNSLAATSTLAAAGDCSFICPGSAFEYCGAGNRLEMYKIGAPPATSTSSTSTGSTSTGSTSTESISTGTSTGTKTSSSTSSSTSAVGTGFPAGWTPQGCWVDGVNGRILQNQQNDNQAMTLESCVKTCAGLGYTIAGMEWGVQCFCDNSVYNGGALAANQADCIMPCGGNSAEICGAGGRMTLYSVGTPQVYQPPGPLKTGLPTGWVYQGCLEDNIASVEIPNEQLSTFPYKVWDTLTNTPLECINHCAAFGFNAAGVEFGSQCFCGDVQNIQVASAPGVSTNPDDPQFLTRSRVPQVYADSLCDAACTGDKLHLCGSGNKLTWYAYQGATPLYKWKIPTGTAAGSYELLIGGVVVPLMTSQMVTGKVTFIEKYGSGEPNGTGAYELDLSQSNNFGAAWRAMTGLQTDVFCSAGLILPDKAGRQLTIGGWAGESNFGVRLYSPDGSDGVPGTHQWAEDKLHLMLQVPRWYPSALIMANGSILIIGGEIGSNAAEQPTLEILPAQGKPDPTTISGYSNTTVYLDFLDRTAPFNLYPFVTVVPSGIFIAYYNEARILDEKTFQTIKTLPNMPGAVNDPTAGRSYQLEGTMVTLPQIWPYTDNLRVLICGGSTTGGGYSIDNCISTEPEAVNPTWDLERMPSRRVMPCMAGLPDGTFVIMNGGQHGVAGFGLGGSPNTNAVLYDPSQPLHQRMSILANTTIARLYHSEAIVLLDGRVLVTGSDPTGDYTNPAGSYPEEYRVEVFNPPYLTAGLPRPTFSITDKDWAYNTDHTFTLTSGSTANLKVSLLGSVVSTHGNSMGQRTLFPKVSCAGTLCTVTAPPNAHTAPPGWYMFFVLDGPTPAVGVYVRIGGDPAGLGNWPQLPGFQLPGI